MTNEDFTIEVENSFNRAKKVMLKKAKEYASEDDRLDNFKRAGAAQGIASSAALVGMAAKHFVSITEMAKNPNDYTTQQWHEKTGDLKNYMVLLEALLIDLEV
jgi:hypothetical protein